MECLRAVGAVCLVTWLGFASSCDVTDAAVYRVTLRTLWSEETFLEGSPRVWPKAQWSPLFVQSHNSSYVLYRTGGLVRQAVRLAQLGRLGQLVDEGREDPRVCDQVTADPGTKAAGETEGLVVVDGRCHLVSAMSLLPSPNWFAGVDSVNLCVDDGWLEEITLDLHPLEVSAASGLATRPSEHPPGLREWPPVATVELVKMKQYSSKELNSLARERMASTLQLKTAKRLQTSDVITDEQSDDVTAQKTQDLLALEEDPVGTPRPGNPDDEVVVVTEGVARPTPEPVDQGPSSMDEAVLAVARGRLRVRGRLPRHFRSRLHHAVNRRTADDCLVSGWGPWSPCSATCGSGVRVRSRAVVNAPTAAGRACPDTSERKTCSAKPCQEMDYSVW